MRVEAERNLLSLVGQRVVGGVDGSKREISRKTIALVDSLGGAFLFEHVSGMVSLGEIACPDIPWAPAFHLSERC
jgi:hypothetical protein